MKDYINNVLRPCSIVMVISLIVPVTLKLLTGYGILFSFLNITATVIATSVLCYTIGIDKEMKVMIKEKVYKIIKKK